ncbi:RHS repeat domain-containing protein, partial [Poritiphilus flavus]
VTTDTFTYDALGRLLKQEQTLGSHTELLAHNTYDGLGQLVKKQVGNTAASPLQVVDYSYNVRGWLKQINDPSSMGSDLFAFGINYNDTQYGGASLYNGNIAETAWKTANDNTLRWYRYSYDALNRITGAIDNSTNMNYRLYGVTYDKNGNILTLNRRGQYNADATVLSHMDKLEYYYDSGNKLTRVKDSGHAVYGFKDSTADNQDYWYDANGNMVRDLNKGIGTSSADGITYNHLNLPIQIKFDNSDQKKIKYIYDATGVKLRKVVEQPSVSSVTTDYAGNYIYEKGNLQFFNHPEGYVEPDGSGGYDYVYQYKDHLDNIRLSYTDANNDGNIETSEIIKETNYYPFGLSHKGYNANVSTFGNSIAKKFQYNGQEFDESLGYNTYDFGARHYMSDLGRWGVIDPKADDILQVDISPYNFSWNNPTNMNDPDGECPWCWGAVIGFAVEYATQVTVNLVEGQSFGDALTDVDGGKLLLATATGAATGGLSSIKTVGSVSKAYKAIAVSSTAAGGNVLKQGIVDKKKTVDPLEMATDALLENIELPKVNLPNVKENKIKTAERQLDRAERVAGDNPRPTREEAVKESKKKVENLKNKKETIQNTNKAINDFKDASAKETAKSGLEKALEDYRFKTKQ